MKPFPKTMLPAAVTAAVLSMITFTSALATDPVENLQTDNGTVVSVETEELEAVLDPALPATAPKNGEGNPGATLGQWMKTAEEMTSLSVASEQALAEVLAEVETGNTASSTVSDTVTGPETAESTAPLPRPVVMPVELGPAGSMSLVPMYNGTWQPAGIQGMDVSGWQAVVDWSAEYDMGARFVYIKASEGDSYRSPAFGDQYKGSANAGMLRGAYHFAIPTPDSSGAKQADYFINNGGGWSADGRTLPGLLDVEYNPYSAYGDMCFDFTAAQMVKWIDDFSNRYQARTGRLPAIYSTTHWWAQCTGNTSAFNDHPLHIASYSTSPGAMPNGWSTYDIWQYSDKGPYSGDSNVFGGDHSKLQDFAGNKHYTPIGGTAPYTAPATSPFADVSTTRPFYREIAWMADRRISGGWATADGTKEYRPNIDVKRDVMAAFLYRAAGSPAYTPPSVSPFVDVSTTHPFYREIAWMADRRISGGWASADGTKEYRPNIDVNRDVMAAFLYRLNLIL